MVAPHVAIVNDHCSLCVSCSKLFDSPTIERSAPQRPQDGRISVDVTSRKVQLSEGKYTEHGGPSTSTKLLFQSILLYTLSSYCRGAWVYPASSAGAEVQTIVAYRSALDAGIGWTDQRQTVDDRVHAIDEALNNVCKRVQHHQFTTELLEQTGHPTEKGRKYTSQSSRAETTASIINFRLSDF